MAEAPFEVVLAAFLGGGTAAFFDEPVFAGAAFDVGFDGEALAAAFAIVSFTADAARFAAFVVFAAVEELLFASPPGAVVSFFFLLAI